MATEFKVGNNIYSFWFGRCIPRNRKGYDYNWQIHIVKLNNGPIREERINHGISFGIKNNKIDWNSFDYKCYFAMEPEFVRYIEKYVKNYAFS